MKYIFIIGAPKCGTSSFFSHITTHSRLLGTQPKETYAFLPDTHPLSAGKSHKDLGDLLLGFKELEKKLTGSQESSNNDRDTGPIFVEATTHNLYSNEAIRAVTSLGDSASVVAMLRQPSQRILSSFRYTKQNLARIPRAFTFCEYVDCLLKDDIEKIKRKITHPASGQILASELDLSTYHVHLKRWFDQLGQDRMKVIISEEYFHDPASHISCILNWLGVADEAELFGGSLTHRNPTRRVGLPWLQRIARILNKHAPGGRFGQSLKTAYFQLQANFSGADNEDYSDGLARLDEYFQPSILELESYLGRSLACWGVERREFLKKSDSTKHLNPMASRVV